MQIHQETFKVDSGWKTIFNKGKLQNPQLVLVFGTRGIITSEKINARIKAKYPDSDVIMASTSGEINDAGIMDDSIVLTAIEFDYTKIKTCSVNISAFNNSERAAKELVKKLDATDLKHLFVVSDGQLINGSELVKGLNSLADEKITATGGLAGDGYDFDEAVVGLNGKPTKGNIVGIGFYGDRLKVGFASKGGWDTFGPERIVTKSSKNVLYEMDGQNALELYKSYLGEEAKDLPSSALFYPLSIRTQDSKEPIVRTVLTINEEDQTMTFAGDIPKGSIATLMKHNPDRMIDGAEAAAQICIEKTKEINKPDLAILVSCVGRKIVLGQNVEEEVEIIRDVVGDDTAITGFYSYGEIAPVQYLSRCELHNQTMTITTLSEI